jgi:glycosyltransferase involved in cell wall biosynthesis
MSSRLRIGSADADVVMFNKGGRDFRLDRLEHGKEAPREFFYGFFELEKAGISAAMLSSAGAVPGMLGAIADRIERGFASVTEIGVRPLSMRLQSASIKNAKVAMSYTDGFSLSLGIGMPQRPHRAVLMGGFHGLSDIENRVPDRMRALARKLIARALTGLDHAFFFGSADRQIAIDRYGLRPELSSVIPFGVDTEFWRPVSNTAEADFVVAVGQDRNRDYDILAAAPGRHPTRIITRQKVNIPAGADHITTSVGDYFSSGSLNDEELRQLYNTALAVVVPLKDVYQPSGYSVTLQAMSCGRPVILSDIRGLWARDVLKHGENCVLVPPGDAVSLGAAIGLLRSNPVLRAQLGCAARATAQARFGLDQIGNGTVALAKLGLDLWSRRNALAA